MPGKTFTIGEVAKILELDAKNNSTVRLWTMTFADCLSPYTRPEKGQLRLYTEDDVKCLTSIRNLRRQHIPYEELRSRLSSGKEVRQGHAAKVAAEAAPTAAKTMAPPSVDDFRTLLSPVFEVTEALRRFVKDSNYVVGIHQELGRIASLMESQSAKMDLLRHDFEVARREPVAAVPSASSTTVGGNGAIAGLPQDYGDGRQLRGSDGSVRSVGLVDSNDPSTEPEPAQLATFTGKSRAEIGELNKYGLRPVPEWLAGQSLRAEYLCHHCGSTTKPLGVTPTARVILRCIECQERLTVPLTRLEAELGAGPGFWARLWMAIRHPLSRHR